MDFNLLTQKAIECINNKICLHQSFEVSDLFEKCEWTLLSKGDRIQFGKHFKNEVIDKRIPNVCYVKRAKNNHSMYIKTED